MADLCNCHNIFNGFIIDLTCFPRKISTSDTKSYACIYLVKYLISKIFIYFGLIYGLNDRYQATRWHSLCHKSDPFRSFTNFWIVIWFFTNV